MRKTKKSLALFICLSIAVFLSALTSAEILISQTSDSYNVGDKFNISITLIYPNEMTDLLRVTFQCAEKEVEIYRNTHSIESNKEEKIMVSTILGNFLIGDVRGQCIVKVSYSNEQKTGSTFGLTSNLEVTTHANALTFSPDEEIILEGAVKKSNSLLEEGFVEVRLEGANVTNFGTVKEGRFSARLRLPEDTKAGHYQIFVRAYERASSGEITNEGTSYEPINVRQVPKSLDIALDSQTIEPNSELSYSVRVLDQAGENINSDVSFKLILPDGKIKSQEIIKSGEARKIFFAKNDSPGNWKIEAGTAGFTASRKVEIGELRELSFKLENSFLEVTNIGNVPYTGFFEITIGEKNEIKELKALEVGASKKFSLKAPEGEYSITIKNADDIQSLGKTFLTGRAISVDDIGGNILGEFTIVIWIILLIIALAVVIYFVRKVKRKSYLGREPSNPGFSLTSLKKTRTENMPVLSASPIQQGERHESAAVALHIKNLSALSSANSEALRAVDGALAKVKEKKARIYVDGDYRVIILAPPIIQGDLYAESIKMAVEMEKAIVNYNRKSALKVQYNFGITLGDLVIDSAEGKFKFMSMDNIIVNAKRIASMTSSGVFITEELHRKTVGTVKAEKLPDRNLWKVVAVTDRSEHKEFIDKFMNRQRPDKK